MSDESVRGVGLLPVGTARLSAGVGPDGAGAELQLTGPALAAVGDFNFVSASPAVYAGVDTSGDTFARKLRYGAGVEVAAAQWPLPIAITGGVGYTNRGLRLTAGLEVPGADVGGKALMTVGANYTNTGGEHRVMFGVRLVAPFGRF